MGDVVFEVEFSDDAGRTYAMAPIRADRLLVQGYAREHRVGLTSRGSRTWLLDWSHQWAGISAPRIRCRLTAASS
ncbi:MAG: hypothetical protein WBG92_02710 [Thiohalocapsa sp.]